MNFKSIILGYGQDGLPILQHKERFKHTYIVGSTGMGKSTLLLNMIRQDIKAEMPLVVLDPSGSLGKEIASFLPADRELLYLSIDSPLPLNPFQQPEMDKNDVIEEFTEVLNTYISLTTSTAETTVLMNQIIRNALQILLDYPQYQNLETLYEFLLYPDFRNKILRSLSRDYDKPKRYFQSFKHDQQESAKRVVSRLSAFIDDPRMYQIVGGARQVDFEDIAKNKKVLLINCYGMSSTKMVFIGNVISHGIKSYFTYRFKAKDSEYPLAVYIDEFQNFITPDFQRILAEGRKYKVAFTLAHQNHHQIPSKLLGSILGNVNTTICFRCGTEEAKNLSQHFRDYSFEDLHNLEEYQFCARIGIKEYQCKGFSKPKSVKDNSLFKLTTKPVPKPPETQKSPVIVKLWSYGEPLEFIEFQ